MRGLIALLLLFLSVPAGAQDVTVSLVTMADGTRTLTHEVIVPAPQEEVWLAVSTVAGWRTWAVPLAREVPGSDRFETSYDPAAAPGSSSVIEQQWIERDPPRRLSYRTTRTPEGFPHADTFRRTISSLELEPVGKAATRVRLVMTGYPPDEAGEALIRFFKEGNRTTLEQLYERFTSGPIDWPARLAAQKGE